MVLQLNEAWNQLCVKAGFIQAGRLAPLPGGRDNPESLLLSSNQGLIDEMIINLSRSSLHYSMNGRVDERRLSYDASQHQASAGEPSTRSVGTGNSPVRNRSPEIAAAGSSSRTGSANSPEHFSIPRVLPDQNQVILGEPALPVCIATWLISSKKGLKLQHWRIEHARSGRRVTWTGIDPAHTFTHHIPPNVFPYTKHASLMKAEKLPGFIILFNEAHRIVWTKGEATRLDEKRKVEYCFVDLKDYKQFQEDLRDKYLLDTLNVDTIKTKQSTGYGDAGNQDLKFWSSRDEDEVYTISFFANHAEKQQREYPIQWFAAKPRWDDRKRIVELQFAGDQRFENDPLNPRSNIISRKFSLGKSSTY